MTRDPAGFISAMTKLAWQSHRDDLGRRPAWWMKAFFNTHPTLTETVEQALRFAADNNIPLEDSKIGV